MNDLRHNECEIKFELPDGKAYNKAVKFLKGVYGTGFGYYSVDGTDRYYRQGNSVVRHRTDNSKPEGFAGELTVKQRTSKTSTSNRVEVDLMFADSVTSGDVTSFLCASGWKGELELFKHSEIFSGIGTPPGIFAVYYVEETAYARPRASPDPGRRYFVEFEIDKDCSATIEEALEALEAWKGYITHRMPGAVLVKDSLYEIYSGRRYTMADPKKE